MQSQLWIDIEGLNCSKADFNRLANPWVGGVILFTRNFENRKQLERLTADIKKYRPDLKIVVDHEGGRIQRFRESFTEIPAMGTLGELYELDQQAAQSKAYQYGETIASELKSVGIDMTFAPVLDLNFNRSSVIGTRAFHSDPNAVIDLAEVFIAGLHSQGMWAIGKHFPGHGFVQADSHVADPVDTRNLDELFAQDLKPYCALAQKLDAVMTAHIVFPHVCKELVTYSSYWIKKILQQEIGFQGRIFSDDLTMHAAAHMPIIERVKRAVAAGCTDLLVCNAPEAVNEILSTNYSEMFA